MNTRLILTVVGAVGVIATGILASRAGRKAQKKLSEEPVVVDIPAEEIQEFFDENTEAVEPVRTKKEVVKLVWKYYIPPVLAGLVTIGAMIGAHHLGAKEIAALTASCAYLTANRDKLEEKIRERYGEEALEDIRAEVMEELSCTANGKISVETTGKGDLLCFEAYSGRWFRSSKEAVDEAIKKFNEMFDCGKGSYMSMNDLYNLFGISETHFGHQMGWPADPEYYDHDIVFDTTLVENDKECGEDLYVIELNPFSYSYPIDYWMEV